MSSSYLIALGSNRRHHSFGRPRQVVRAAMEEISALGTVTARSKVITTDPIGPAQRRFANAAITLECEYDPHAILAGLKHLEREFGRRDGQRWGDRVLDLDIVLWSGGVVLSRTLTIPHSEYRKRDFVLKPAQMIAPQWRDPVTGLTIRQFACEDIGTALGAGLSKRETGRASRRFPGETPLLLTEGPVL